MSKVGIYSGTFDPVHQGHMAFCRAAAEACSLDSVWLLPEREPRAKAGVTDFAQRLHMLDLATVSQPGVSVLELPDKQFTVRHTLPKLQQKFSGSKLFLLLGSDVVQTFTYRWDGICELLMSMHLVIGLREGDSQERVQAVLGQLQAEYDAPLRYTIIGSPRAHLASLRIRRQVHAPDELDPQVAAYIANQQLYKAQ